MVMIHDKSKSAGRRRQGHGGKLQILADELPVSVRKILFYTRESIVLLVFLLPEIRFCYYATQGGAIATGTGGGINA